MYPSPKRADTLARWFAASIVKGNTSFLKRTAFPVAAIIDPDELDDYLDLQDPNIRRLMDDGEAEHRAGRSRPATDLLAELRKQPARPGRSRRQHV